MKHEYTFEELDELKKIYDESGEAGLDITEMRALRKAGLLTQGLPEKPSKRDLILAHCKQRIDQGQPFDRAETAEALGLSPKTVGNIISKLRNDGLLPATPAQRKPRKTTEKKETIMTITQKLEAAASTSTQKLTAANITEEKLTATDFTPGTINVKPQATADPRAIIADALVYIYDSISALQRTAFRANDKVVYGFATKLLNGELMDLKANYSKDAK